MDSYNGIPPGYMPNVKPKEWIMPYYTEFPYWISQVYGIKKEQNGRINNRINKMTIGNQQVLIESPCQLFEHQQFIRNFIGSIESPYRGILLFHGLGTGKTITSISAAESLSSNRKIVVMLPASLLRNYINEITHCGNSFFNYKREWFFISDTDESFHEYKMKMSKYGISLKDIRKQKGVWVFAFIKHPNIKSMHYDKFSTEEQGQISQQVDSMIMKRYHFLHYNGISLNNIKDLGRDFFNNKTVIIDEIHNFISSVKNESTNRRLLYDMLMHSHNVKVIGLSGTPIINDIYEISFLANLLSGFVHIHTLSFVSNSQFMQNIEQIKQYLHKHLLVESFELLQSNGAIKIKTVPLNFQKMNENEKSFAKNSIKWNETQKFNTETEQIDFITHELINNFGLVIKTKKSDQYTLLPEQKETFEKYFIDKDAIENSSSLKHNENIQVIKNPKVLMRRLQGVISYYESFDQSKFPKVNEAEVIRVKMPAYVYEKYESVREKERKDELKAKRTRSENEEGKNQKSLNVYKAASRTLCLFCFPEDIPRMYPADLRKMALQELDDVNNISNDQTENKGNNVDKEKRLDYDYRKAKMMENLRRNATKYLTGEGLKTYGIKYFELMKRLNMSKGSVLIYSLFREVEGIGIMKEVLDVNGYAQIDIINKRNIGWSLILPAKEFWDKPFYITFTQDKLKNKILIDIFNSDFDLLPTEIMNQLKTVLKYKEQIDSNYKSENANLKGELIKILMVTKSASEGISLKNVRQVHILEPYWNPILIKQVIGRAVRVNSHKQLPIKDRVVDIFMYIMCLGDHKLEEDDNLTSDEVIEQIAARKNVQIKALQLLLQKSSIDCEMNQKEHSHIDECFKIPKSYGKYAYSHDITEDITDDMLENKLVKKLSTRTIKTIFNAKTKQTVYYIDETKEIIDMVLFKALKQKRVIGKIEKQSNGKIIPLF
jgi:superfamily II DNA or RNA helicase